MPTDAEEWSPDQQDALIAHVEALVRASESRLLEAVQAAAVAGERSARQRLDAIFAQLESLLSLRDVVPLEHLLPPTRRWAASPDLLLQIVRHIDSTTPSLVMELGSGVSSVVMAAMLRRGGRGRLLSIEHDGPYATRTRGELARQDLTLVAAVIHAPLGDVTIRGQSWRWYSLPPDAVPPGIDFVVVDGPPGPTGPLARNPLFRSTTTVWRPERPSSSTTERDRTSARSSRGGNGSSQDSTRPSYRSKRGPGSSAAASEERRLGVDPPYASPPYRGGDACQRAGSAAIAAARSPDRALLHRGVRRELPARGHRPRAQLRQVCPMRHLTVFTDLRGVFDDSHMRDFGDLVSRYPTSQHHVWARHGVFKYALFAEMQHTYPRETIAWIDADMLVFGDLTRHLVDGKFNVMAHGRRDGDTVPVGDGLVVPWTA